ncbi:MAG: stage II sporulation protein P [Clostridia bacterium]|nr:stage II sporulation protein P [Clostridia bacterium]
MNRRWCLERVIRWWMILFVFILCFPKAQAASIDLTEPDALENGFTLEVLAVRQPRTTGRRVYIYHTHTYEAYEMDSENAYKQTEKWRTADTDYNVVRVGEELSARLREAGVEVTHDTTAYEMPKLSTAYSRSLAGIQKAAEKGYDLYIDLHRDSYSKGNGPNAVLVGGQETARLLILIGKGSGTSLDEKPDWEANEKVAQIISDFLNQRAENLCRGVSLKSGRYNQQAATPSILIEVGNNKNTLQEALNAAEPLARAICQYFDTLP